MASDSFQGTKLEIDTAVSGGPPWSAVGEVMDVGEWGPEQDTYEKTNLRSAVRTYGGARLYGLGTASHKLAYDNADVGQDACRAAAISGATKQFRFTYPGNITRTVSAIVKSFKDGGSIAQRWDATMVLQFTGAFVEGTAS